MLPNVRHHYQTQNSQDLDIYIYTKLGLIFSNIIFFPIQLWNGPHKKIIRCLTDINQCLTDINQF